MMNVISAKNPVYGDVAKTFVNLEVLFAELESEGFLPFTARPDDCEWYGRDIYVRAISGEFGGAPADYVPPEIQVPQDASAVSVRRALTTLGLRAEFEAWVSTSTFSNRDYWEYEPFLLRSASIWSDWVASSAITDAQVDAIFIATAAP